MKLRNAAVQECTSKHAVRSLYLHFDNSPVWNKEPEETSYLVNLLSLVLNKSVKSLALHHIPEGRTELLCDKCS